MDLVLLLLFCFVSHSLYIDLPAGVVLALSLVRMLSASVFVFPRIASTFSNHAEYQWREVGFIPQQ